MPWVQQYAPVGGVVASACLAAIPLIILFYMLAVRKAKGHVAAAAGLIGALIVAQKATWPPLWAWPWRLCWPWLCGGCLSAPR